MKNVKLLTSYVEDNDYEGLITAIAKHLRQMDTDSSDPKDCLTIRVLSEFGSFMMRMSGHSYHDDKMRDEIFQMAQKIDAILEDNYDANLTFIQIMAKVSNYTFKVEFAEKKGFNSLDDINVWIDEY